MSPDPHPDFDELAPWENGGPEPIDNQKRAEEDERSVMLTAASTVPIGRPAWAWQDRVPLAGVTLVPGREGEGKTALVGHMAARLTRGDLPGDRFGTPGDVLYIGHEDDRSTVLVPRLIAAGADLDRFLFVDLPRGFPFSVSVDTEALAAAAAGRDIAAIVVDPLDAHLGVVDTHRKADVQASIGRLAGLTQRLRCAGVGIAHLNKGDSRELLLKVVGSVGLTTSVRSVLAVGPHPERPEVEKVAVLAKANMTDKTKVPALRFRVEGSSVPHPDGGVVDTACVVMLGEEIGLKADSIIGQGSPEERSALEEAVEWLASVLEGGPTPKADLTKWARSEGIAEATLKRAAQALGVTSSRDTSRQGRPATWSLPGYGSTVMAQNGMSHNHTPSDQGKRASEGGYGSSLGDEPKPPDAVPFEDEDRWSDYLDDEVPA